MLADETARGATDGEKKRKGEKGKTEKKKRREEKEGRSSNTSGRDFLHPKTIQG